MPRITFRFVCALVFGMIVGSATAQDLTGAKDHPVIKRFAGSTIIGYDQKRFDQYQLQAGPFKRYDARAGAPEYAQTLALEGAVTRIWYESPGATTATELLRNYENELTAGGFEILYDSTKDGSLRAVPGYLIRFGGDPVRTSRTKYVFAAANQDGTRFASLKLARPSGDLYVGVTTVEWAAPDPTYKTQKAAYAAVEIVEVAAMQQQMVTVSASDMSKAMAATGRVALYGILFDTNKADIKAESKPALVEIDKLLKADPALKLRVVGHTDNQGALDANIALSKRRAEAVNAALVAQYGIVASRLSAFGVADLAPVASNASEDGRAKNRRVELVPQ